MARRQNYPPTWVKIKNIPAPPFRLTVLKALCTNGKGWHTAEDLARICRAPVGVKSIASQIKALRMTHGIVIRSRKLAIRKAGVVPSEYRVVESFRSLTS